jgi:hypothetical protein
MKTNDFPSKQSTQLQIISLITLTLLLISFLWLFYKIYAYQEIRLKSSSFSYLCDGLYIGNFLKFILLIFFAILLFTALRQNVRFKWLAYLTFIFGTFSLFCIFSDWAALHDIEHGEPDVTTEWSILKTGLVINFIFYIIGFLTIIKIKREVKTSHINRKSIIDETIFEVIHYTGIVCSSAGLCFVLFIYLLLVQNDYVINKRDVILIISFCVIIFLPYIFAIIYWIIKLIREENLSPHDEKQKHDLAMSGLITWLLSIPLVSVFFVINHARNSEIWSVIYLPFYLFTTFLIFSISVMYNYKKS